MKGWPSGAVARVVGPAFVLLASAGALTAGCSIDEALVGGQCAAGYTQCGRVCVKGPTCSSLDDAGLDPWADAASETSGSDEAPADSGIDEDGWAAADQASPDGGWRKDSSTDVDASEGGQAGWDAEASASADADANGSSDAPPDAGSLPDGGEQEAADGDAEVDATDASFTDTGAADGSDASDSSAADGSSNEAGNPCTQPLSYCGGQCTDTRVDPLNCGECSVVCASQLCSNSQCVGAAGGGVVYIGHDYATTLSGTAQARVLSNAVFIPQSNPLHVMSYERYANPNAVTRVDSILTGIASQTGRTLNLTSTSTDADINNRLSSPGYDVLLVHDQSGAADGALAALGTRWASTLATFTTAGGIVVVLDGGSGIGQMPAFSSATGLLQVSAHTPLTLGTPLVVASRLDVVGIGVISPYGAGQSSVSLSTEPNTANVVYVVELESDAGMGAPIAVHKAF